MLKARAIIFVNWLFLFGCWIVAVSTTRNDSLDSKLWMLNLSHVQITSSKHVILVQTNADRNDTILQSASYHCVVDPPSIFCSKDPVPVKGCVKPLNASLNSHARYICTLEGDFLYSNEYQFSILLRICNMTIQRTINFVVDNDGLKPMINVRGIGESKRGLLLTWDQIDYPAVVRMAKQEDTRKVVEAEYWRKQKGTKLRKKFTMGLNRNQALLKDLDTLTTYCFHMRYRLRFNDFLRLPWASWSAENCARTLGVPSASILDAKCSMKTYYNGSELKIHYKLPPPLTWNGKLTRIKIRIFSISFTKNLELTISGPNLGNSNISVISMQISSFEVPNIRASLCTSGGCGNTTLMRCRQMKEKLSKIEENVLPYVLAGSALFFLAVIIMVSILLFRAKTEALPVTTSFGEIDIINQRSSGEYEVPEPRPREYCRTSEFLGAQKVEGEQGVMTSL